MILLIGILKIMDISTSGFSLNFALSVNKENSLLKNTTPTPQLTNNPTITLTTSPIRITDTAFVIPSNTPTLTSTPTIQASYTPLPQPTLLTFSNQWKEVKISQGLRSAPVAIHGVWFGPTEHLTFSEADRGKSLIINVDSGANELRIELWGGKIGINENSWWSIHPQIALSTGTGDKPRIETSPNLTWKIVPGDYTVFFASYSTNGIVPDYLIRYKINITN